MRHHNFFAAGLLAYALSIPSGVVAQNVADLSGDWDSSYGAINLSATADGYRGSYATDNGRIRFRYTVSGEYEGEWSEGSSAVRCATPHIGTGSYHWGRVKFAAPAERAPFTMQWGYCDKGELTRSWQVTPKPEPETENPTVATNSPFFGNWRVRWLDTEEPEAIVSVYRKYEWDCINREDSWCQRRTAPDAVIITTAGQDARAAGYDGRPKVDYTTIAGGEMTINWSYGHIAYWGATSKVRLRSGDSALGEWETNHNTGQEVWTRVRSRVNYAEAHKQLGDGRVVKERKPIGAPVTVYTEYAGPVASMRGNRPQAYFDIYGENLWGEHEYFLPRQTGVEITSVHYICADGTTQSFFYGNTTCMDVGGVVGRRFNLVIWYDAAPGIKVVRFNDQLIPFKLEVAGYPEPVVVEPEEPELTRVVLLDDQVSQRQAEGAEVKDYTYPYTENGEPRSGLATRMLAVVGKNLALHGGPHFSSADPAISYQRLQLPENIQGAVRRAAEELSGAAIADDEEVMLVRADLKPGVRQGIKAIYLNGERDDWSLLFANPFGALQFLREGTTLNDSRENVVYFGETIRVGAKALDRDTPIDGLQIVLEAEVYPALQTQARNPSRRIGRFPLAASDDGGPTDNFAVSRRFLVHKQGADDNPAPEEGETAIVIRENERIVARMADRFSLVTVPPAISAPVLSGPKRGELWQSALDKVAVCVGGDSKSESFPSETSAVFEDWLLTEAVANMFSERDGTRRTRVTKGDHAALILIRDELLPLVEAANERLVQYTGSGQAGETKAQSFYTQARANPKSRQNTFWTARKEPAVWTEIVESTQASGQPTLVSRGIYLQQMLDFSKFQKLIQDRRKSSPPNIRDTQDRINKIVSKHIDMQHQETIGAIGRAIDAGNCKVEELLVIAGQPVEPAIASLMPDLVKQENGRWRPDNEARSYVRSVHILGAEVRAMKKYGQIDDAYKAMGVALVAAPAAFAGSAIAAGGSTGAIVGGAAFTGLAVGADIFDMAYFGRKGLEEYLSGEQDYLTAMGLSPVLSKEVIEEARANRGSAFAAALGLVAPGLSGGGGLSALDDIRRVANGRALARSGRDLSSLDELSETERVDLLAYHKHLNESAASSTGRLDETMQDDLNRLDKTLVDWGASPRTDDFDFLDLGDLGSSRPGSSVDNAADGAGVSKTEVEGSPLDKTDFDPNAPKNKYRTPLDREPPLKLPEDIAGKAEDLPIGEASKHLKNRDVAKLMQLRRPLTPDEQAMRDDLLRQWINNPDSMSETKRRVMEAAVGKKYAGRFAPVDDSPILPVSPGRIDDFLDSKPGAYSDHLTDAQAQRYFEDGIDLSADDLIIKMDLMRDGRAPASAATDPKLHAALREAFSNHPGLPKTKPLGPNGTEIDSPFTPPTNKGPNDTNIEPPFTPPGNTATDPNETIVFDQSALEPLGRIPSNAQMDRVGPFKGIVMEEMYPGYFRFPDSVKRMPAGTKQSIANPQTPMTLDPQKSTKYLYTVMPNGEVRYIPQQYIQRVTSEGRPALAEKFKHSMLTEGGVAGQSGEINFVNGRWVIDSESGRYGAYALQRQDGGMSAISRSEESLNAAKEILEGYRVRGPDGSTITLESGYVSR